MVARYREHRLFGRKRGRRVEGESPPRTCCKRAVSPPATVELDMQMILGRLEAVTGWERRHHRTWMIGSVAFVWFLWVVPFLMLEVASDNESGYTAHLAVTAVVIGIGRQGIDVLAVRLFASALAVVATVHVTCSGFVDCFTAYEFVVPGLGGFLTVLMWMVAVPVNIAWSRGVMSLAPELPWHRLARLRTRQKVTLVTACIVALGVYYFSLGIPAY